MIDYITGMLEAGGGAYDPPDFGKSEGAAGQRRRAALLLAPPDFQTLQHAWVYVFNRLASKGLFDHGHVTEFFHYTFCNSNHKSDLFFCSSDKSKACGLKSLAHFSYLSF